MVAKELTRLVRQEQERLKEALSINEDKPDIAKDIFEIDRSVTLSKNGEILTIEPDFISIDELGNGMYNVRYLNVNGGVIGSEEMPEKRCRMLFANELPNNSK